MRARSAWVLLLLLVLVIPMRGLDANAMPPLPRPEAGLFRTTVTVADKHRGIQLQEQGVTVVSRPTAGTWQVLANEAQLEALARLGFRPEGTTAVGELAAYGEASQMLQSLRPVLAAANAATDANHRALDQAVGALDRQQLDLVAALSAGDDDGDGLTNTQEAWWCTDPNNADSDGDGIPDKDEVDALKRWVRNDISDPAKAFTRAPASGKPFAGWPRTGTGTGSPCPDDDKDSVPDQAERWELGLNANKESTDGDKFDDGQEVFGLTDCPGSGAFCGYGALPRDSEFGTWAASMPAFVKAPGNHPLVAAFPIPEIDVVESSLHVQAATNVTSSNTVTEGTERTYSTAKTEGTSDSVADTQTWNSWEEVSRSVEKPLGQNQHAFGSTELNLTIDWQRVGNFATGAAKVVGAGAAIAGGCLGPSLVTGGGAALTPIGWIVCGATVVGAAPTLFEGGAQLINSLKPDDVQTTAGSNKKSASSGQVRTQDDQQSTTTRLRDPNGNSRVQEGNDRSFAANGALVVSKLSEIAYAIDRPRETTTNSSGQSRGGAHTDTHTTYEEHTVTNGENFLNQTAWGSATAIDSVHAADLWFTYRVKNSGTEYARDIADLVFNVFIGDNPDPAYTYFVAPDIGGDGKFHNFMPGETNSYTSRRIPLTLEQMKTIDLGGKLRIVVQDFTYGIDEVLYADAAASGVQLAIEDGTEDGDETIDRYLVPTWTPGEKTLDVLGRYFPHESDEQGNLVSIWTPEYRSDTPSWCDQPKAVGAGSNRTLWCRHALSTADWWNVYTNGLGNGSEGFQTTPASGGALALFRFNKDSDLDGYSDRSERRLGTNPADASSFPRPELLAGVNCKSPVASTRSCTLSLLNTGLYDAYGVEAVMVSPDATTTITNNTVGGSGRVKAQKQVVVGSHVALAQPLPSVWGQPGHASPSAGGYYTGDADRTYTFTAACGLPGGCAVGQGAWSLNWSDNTGGSGSIPFGAGYASPNFQPVAFGVTLALQSGRVSNGESFSVLATTPRDTFQYTTTGGAPVPPIVIVSYNDPQGNHRFVIPPSAMNLSSPTDNLATFTGQMLGDPGVEIVTTGPSLTGANSTTLMVNNPSGTTLTDAQLHLVFIDPLGNPVKEVTTTATFPPGPKGVAIAWDTATFSPAYDATKDYLVMAFLTDAEGNILDAGGRPLSSFQADPLPEIDGNAAGALSWDVGAVPQGTLLRRTFSLASVGARELLAAIDASGAAPAVTVSGPSPSALGPGDIGQYAVFIDTGLLSAGAFAYNLPVRTSDLDEPTATLAISGTVTGVLGGGAGGGGAALRPLDYAVTIPGSHTQGETYEFTHPLGPDVTNLSPVRVFDSTYSTQLGVGKAFTGASSADATLFGDGADGDLVVATGQTTYLLGERTYNTPLADSRLIETAPAGQAWVRVAYPSLFGAGQELIVHQTQGDTGVGSYEFVKIDHISADVLYFTTALTQTFTQDGTCLGSGTVCYRAQVRIVPHYRNVTVQSGGTLRCPGWNSTSALIFQTVTQYPDGTGSGGVCPFRVSGTLTVEPGSVVDASGAGFWGSYGFGFGTTHSGESYWHTWNIDLGYVHCLAVNSGAGSSGRDNNNQAPGGGGYGTVGAQGGNAGCPGGATYGGPDLRTSAAGGAGIDLGSGGGSSSWFIGGRGGGALMVFAKTADVQGTVRASGQNGQDASSAALNNGDPESGGGGSGGSVLMVVGNATLGSNRVTADGGAGGQPYPLNSPTSFRGGTGGVGRIMVQACQSFTGTTSPVAFTAPLTCYIAEQIPPGSATTRLTIPNTFASGRTYNIQYGRVLLPTASGQITTLRVPAGQWESVSLHALISGTGAGTATMTLDVGNDGSIECTYDGTPGAGADFLCNAVALRDAFNAYWQARGGSGNIDVPVRVTLSPAGQVILTDLQMAPTASTLQYVNLLAQSYGNVKLDLQVGDTGTGAVDVSIDVGADGSIDWTQRYDNATFPLKVTTADVSTAVSAYMVGKTGQQDVPVRLYLTPAISRRLTGFSATASARPDLRVQALTPSPASPTEGDDVIVSATIKNDGVASGGVAVSFFATAPVWGRTYIGSAFLPAVGAGATAPASITWKTAGFYGNVPIEAVVDAYNRTLETNEGNNSLSTSLTISTRPDLQVSAITLSDPEPVAGQTGVTASVKIKNFGQAAAAASTLRVYDGDPATGALVSELATPSIAGAGETTVPVPWTPVPAAGLHTLVAVADATGPNPAWQSVHESNESNNRKALPLWVGLAGPVAIDSGAAGDIAYTAANGAGFVDPQGDDLAGNCGTSNDQTFRLDPSGAATYRFDNLQPGHSYHVDVTMFECGQAVNRQQTVFADGSAISDTVSLGDGTIHRLSLRLDPALYADRTVTVSIQSPDGLGALVSGITLTDIDYRYADAGGAADASYAAAPVVPRRFGWLDGSAITTWGTLPYKSGRSDLLDNDVRYQFDGLAAAKNYVVHLTMFVQTGGTRIQDVQVNGATLASNVSIAAGARTALDLPIPVNAYQSGGSIVVTLNRTNGAGAIVNEIALEERTLPQLGANKLAFVQQPLSGHMAQAFTTDVVVAIQDAASTTVTSDSATVVTLSATGPGVFTCPSGLSATASGGAATFSGCSADLPGAYTLKATGGLLASAASPPINVIGVSPHQLSAVANGGGVTIFGRNPNSDLWYRTNSAAAWGPWSLVATGANVASRPAAVRRAAGDTFVFYRGLAANDLQYVRQSSTGAWDSVRSLGGIISGAPEAALDGNGDIVIVTQNPGGGMFYERLNTATGTFSGWLALDGALASQITLVQHQGDIYLFGLNAAGAPFTRTWSASARDWGAWTNLGGILAGEVSGTSFGGNLSIFSLNQGGALFSRQLISGSWGPWINLGGLLSPSPASAAYGGTLFVAGTNLLGLLWVQSSTDGATFSGWTGLAGFLGSTPEAVAAPDGLYAFVLSASGNLFHRKWDGAAWGPWTNLGGILATE